MKLHLHNVNILFYTLFRTELSVHEARKVFRGVRIAEEPVQAWSENSIRSSSCKVLRHTYGNRSS